jgi:predicted RNA-binding Zn ribbon-like protein
MNASPRPLPELARETPDELRRLLLFLNSRPVGYEPEALTDPAAAGTYLAAAGVELDGGALRPRDLSTLLELRTALLAAVEGDEGAWEALDRLAAAAPVTFTFGADGASGTRPAKQGVQRIVAQLLGDVQGALASGRWSRLRLCAFAPCGGAFYDATRSRTQRWHSYATCGNRVNVARHRERAASS